jgi:hypothetical protein
MSFAASADKLGLSGNYMCSGYDSHDGAYSNGKLTLTLDAKNSDFANNYGAYHVLLIESDGTKYVGEIAASGNDLAIYFENTDPSSQTDRGVGIAYVTHDKDAHGNVQTEFHKFYYEPAYMGGGNGSDVCVKTN